MCIEPWREKLVHNVRRHWGRHYNPYLRTCAGQHALSVPPRSNVRQRAAEAAEAAGRGRAAGSRCCCGTDWWRRPAGQHEYRSQFVMQSSELQELLSKAATAGAELALSGRKRPASAVDLTANDDEEAPPVSVKTEPGTAAAAPPVALGRHGGRGHMGLAAVGMRPPSYGGKGFPGVPAARLEPAAAAAANAASVGFRQFGHRTISSSPALLGAFRPASSSFDEAPYPGYYEAAAPELLQSAAPRQYAAGGHMPLPGVGDAYFAPAAGATVMRPMSEA